MTGYINAYKNNETYVKSLNKRTHIVEEELKEFLVEAQNKDNKWILAKAFKAATYPLRHKNGDKHKKTRNPTSAPGRSRSWPYSWKN